MSVWECLIIGLVGLFVFGPQQLPHLARRAGQMMRQGQKVIKQITAPLDQEPPADPK